jgi:Spy/CpxP family protein refolding chaperone
MRNLIAAMALVGAMSVCAALRADDESKPEQKGKGVILVVMIQDHHLSDAEEAKIAEIRTEYKPKVQEAAKDLAAVVKEEVQKVRRVLTPEQRKMLKKAKAERKQLRATRLSERIAHLEDLDLTDAEVAKIRAIRKEYRPKVAKAMTKLEGILNDEQKEARKEGLKAGKKRREILASLKLSDDQKAKVQAVGDTVRTLLREELEQMRDVLTESQKEKLQEFKKERKEKIRDRMAHRIATLKDLGLNDDQKTQIADIRKEYRPKVQEAGNKLRATIREEVAEILAVIKE